MTGEDLLAFTRFIINEETAGYWNDDRVQDCLNFALKQWNIKFAHSRQKDYLESDTLTLAASTQSVSLPSDSNGVVYMITDDGNYDVPLRVIPFNRVDENSTYNPSGFCLAGGKVYFNSSPSSEKTYTIWHFRKATAIDVTDDTDQIDFPLSHHELIGLEACVFAHMRENVSNELLLLERERAIKSIELLMSTNVVGTNLSTYDNCEISFRGK